MKENLWDDDVLEKYTVRKKKPLACIARENAVKYGVGCNRAELPEILAALIGVVPDETMNALLSENIQKLADKSEEELMSLPGVGKEKALRLTAAFELARRLMKAAPAELPVIKSPQDVASLFMDEMRYLEQERFRVLLLNVKNRLIGEADIYVGTLNSTPAHPREVFRQAIRRNAAAVILVHNHPSGDPEPSREDVDVTKRLVDVGKTIGIEVLDHVVIGDGRWLSMKAKCLI
ncbi:MAG: JAB domain-containing protein [Dehalococcoidia bacterium]|nr:MAG: JAB domain-containing protein [Dehalococcoidia bacterium]